MGMQRYFFSAIGLSGEKAQLIIGEDPNADWVRYADAMERERVLREDNERLLEQVRNIADDLGCQEEESHRHHHGRCIFFAIHKLQDDLDRAIKERDAARAELAQ